MITSIRLQNYRSYKDSSFEFGPGVNIVVGPNASGKTNLLESVVVLGRGGSFKSRDAELIQFKKSWARLEANFKNHVRVVKLESDGEQVSKTFMLDDKPFKRLSLDRTVPVVLFEPNHLQLISRGPETRREYFDDLLERSQPTYKTLAASYRRTLAQRNALLKQHRTKATQQLFAWNIRLSELGSQVVDARQKLIDDINKGISKNYSQIAGKRSKLQVSYDCQFPPANYASRMLSKLEKSTDLDFERGFTGSGPHREDILLFLNGQPASATASRGETRSLLLALKIFELELIKNARGQTPLFLLDDVFSELDGRRRRALVDSLTGHQSIITTTDADTVVEYFSGKHNLISLSH